MIAQVESLDLSDPASYMASLEWVRNNVILRPTTEGSILQLHVTAIGATATLFMNPVNHYILAFQGADAVYVLQDETSTVFRGALESMFASKKTKMDIVQLGLAAHHGYRGLETINQGKHRVFHKLNFQEVQALDRYSRKSHSYSHLRRPLSLLVYMIAEGARFSMVQNDMMGIYYGRTVEASSAVKSYHDAHDLQNMAQAYFPQERTSVGVEKLQKRSVEFEEILDWYQARSPDKDRKQLAVELLAGRDPAKGASGNGYMQRFQSMCVSLKISRAEQVVDLIARCQKDAVVSAAKSGVIAPSIGFQG